MFLLLIAAVFLCCGFWHVTMEATLKLLLVCLWKCVCDTVVFLMHCSLCTGRIHLCLILFSVLCKMFIYCKCFGVWHPL